LLIKIKELLESTDSFKDISEKETKMRKLMEIDIDDDWTLVGT